MGCYELERNRGFIIIAIVATLYVLNFMLLTSSRIDIMNYTAFETDAFQPMFGEACCSWWPCSHFIMYAFLGYFAPSCWKLWMAISVGWEAFEFMCGYVNPRKGEVVSGTEYGDRDFNGWMNGSIKDLVFNTAGLAIGIMINQISRLP